MLKKQVAVELMKHLVTHDWHGYSQVSRWGDGEGTCDIDIGGKVYQLEQGDRDCSSGVISAYEAAGISCGGATYTGNMRSCMCATGNFKWHPMSSGYVAQAGDIYLNEACHTAMCLSAVPDMLMEFAISETAALTGQRGIRPAMKATSVRITTTHGMESWSVSTAKRPRLVQSLTRQHQQIPILLDSQVALQGRSW